MDEGKVLGKIRALLDKASHPGTSETEAEIYHAKAERLMIEYAIEEAELEASRPAVARMVPEKLHIEVCAAGSPISEQLCTLLGALASHCRCKIVFYNHGGQSKYRRTDAVAVGYPTDLRYLEMLFTTLYLHMASHVEPEVDPGMSFDWNVHNLHEAGVKWRRIADLMNRTFVGMAESEQRAAWRKSVRPSKDQPNVLVPWPDGHRLINAYKRQCAEIGEEPRAIQSPVTYQRNFAIGYVGRISTRLYKMRLANPTAGTALALRYENVNEKFDEFFPPESLSRSKVRDIRQDYEAQARGRKAGDSADLSGGQNATEDRKAGELA